MKKITMLLVAVTLSVAASAQLEIRPFVGANFSGVNNTPSGLVTESKFGYQVGGGLLFGDRVYLNPSIAYFSRKTEYRTNSSLLPELTFEQEVNGVIIPVLVGIHVVDPETDPIANLRIFAGPSFMFLSKTEYDDGEFNENIDWNDSQWGAQVGAGVDVSIFFVDVGYEFGLTNSHDGLQGEDSIFDNFDEVKQNTFYVNAGLRLRLAE